MIKRTSGDWRSLVGGATMALVLVSGSAGVLCTGCGDGREPPKTANVPAKDMPAGEMWTGVYYHPVFGYLHLVEEGTNVVGRWKRTDQSRWGELSGTKRGNVLHYTWKEHKYGLLGPSAESHGRGYFSYIMNGEGHPELKGQFGLDSDEVGSDWNCVKQAKMDPDLKSITGDVPGGTPSTGVLE